MASPRRQSDHMRLVYDQPGDPRPDPERDARQLPYNIPVEQAFLGALLVNNQVLGRVEASLRPDHFFEPVHGDIYASCQHLIGLGREATPVNLAHFFVGDQRLDDVGGEQYLSVLAASLVSVLECEDYARTIVELAQRRRLIEIGNQLVQEAYRPEVDDPPAQVAHRASDAIQEALGWTPRQSVLQTASETALASLEASQAVRRGDATAGLLSGLRRLDGLTGAVRPGLLYLLGARPGMGKSALAARLVRSWARNLASGLQEDQRVPPVLVHTLEMKAAEWGSRLLSQASAIPYQDIDAGTLTDEQYAQLTRLHGELPAHLLFDETANLTLAQIRDSAFTVRRQHGGRLGALVIDHAGLIRPSADARRQYGKVHQVEEISNGLKVLAKDLGCPVLALLQLSRAVESREDKHPQLSDLRDSGAWEQDADVVMLLYRAEYYLARDLQEAESAGDLQRQGEIMQKMGRARGICEVSVPKRRGGKAGYCKLLVNLGTNRWQDLGLTAEDQREQRAEDNQGAMTL